MNRETYLYAQDIKNINIKACEPHTEEMIRNFLPKLIEKEKKNEMKVVLLLKENA